MTTTPIKQAGLAAQQADDIAQEIAERVGSPVRTARPRRLLQARLLGGGEPLLLRTELDDHGRPTDVASIRGTAPEAAEGAAKVLGRYITPYLEQLAPAA